MKKKSHRPGVHEGFLLARHLKLEGLRREGHSELVAAIEALVGVDRVTISDEHSVLQVAYDGSKCRMEDIQEAPHENGCSFGHDWWTGLKTNWYHFTDENVRANSQHVPPC